jgi:membrane protein implicated in regulation of membrane protease activity
MTDLIDLIDLRWGWWIAAVILAAAEIFVPGVFLIWLALAALITGAIALLFGPPLAVDLAIFAVAAIASIYIGGNVYRRNATTTEPLLNNRAARMIGTRVTVCEAIVGGQGRATDGDSFWSAKGPDMAAGTIAIVTAVEGNTMVVEPAA